MGEQTEPSIENLKRLLEERTAELEKVRARLAIADQKLSDQFAERDQNEKLFRPSDEHYRLLFENNPYPMWVYDTADYKILAVNEAAIRDYGYTQKEFLGLTILDLRPEEDLERFRQHLLQLEDFPNVEDLWRHRKKDGIIIHVRVRAHPIPFGGKKARMVLSSDVTERRKAEEALRNSEERFQLVARATQDAIYDWNVPQDTVSWNDGFTHLFGYSRAEVEPGAASWSNRIHPEDSERVLQNLNSAISARQQVWSFEYRFRRKDNSYATVFDRAFLIFDSEGAVLRVIGSMIDVSQRKLAQERLEKQKQYFATLHDTAINLMSRLDLNDVLQAIVKRMCALTKLPSAFLYLFNEEANEMRLRVGTGFAQDFLGHKANFGLGVVGKVWETGQPVIVEDYQNWPSAMKEPALALLQSIIGVPLKSGERVIGVLGVETVTERHSFSRDEIDVFTSFAHLASLAFDNARLYTEAQKELAERIHAEDALRKSEEKFRLLFEESKDVFFISSTDGRFTDINPAGVALFGYSSKEEMLAIRIDADLFHDPASRQAYQSQMKDQGYVKDFELRLRKKDGSVLTVLETATAVFDENRSVVAYRGIMRDVSQLKHLQQQLLQWQKIETIGQLAGGVAHDFNNLLMAISGHCEILEMKMQPEDPLLRDLAEIRKAAEAGASLTRQLLAFSRKQVLEPKVVSLNRLLAGMKNMLRRLIGEQINLEFIFDPQLGMVKVDPNQFEQVILNLAVNARDAMPDGGKLSIETTNLSLSGAYRDTTFPGLEGDYVMIRVADTGCGMDAETMSHIFEPFFTTKQDGQGTGLGLPTVFGIVNQSGGHIFVDSHVSGGSDFKIYLPRVDQPQEEIPPLQGTPSNESREARILLVDDNESILQAVGTFLDMQGYKVSSTHSPLLALDLSKHMGAIDLLITDVVMPSMTGPQLAEAIKAINPQMKVLFLSGYSDEAVRKHGVLNENASYLQKPASMQDLMKKINHLLQ